VRLVIEGTIIVIILLISSFLLNVFTLLAPVFNLVMCISAVNDVMQILVIPILPWAAFL
jgi:hypothetical protein